MTKRQMIDEIISMNQTAKPGFLARFDDIDLDEYLRHLREKRVSRLSGDASRYQRYFTTAQPAAASVPLARQSGAESAAATAVAVIEDSSSAEPVGVFVAEPPAAREQESPAEQSEAVESAEQAEDVQAVEPAAPQRATVPTPAFVPFRQSAAFRVSLPAPAKVDDEKIADDVAAAEPAGDGMPADEFTQVPPAGAEAAADQQDEQELVVAPVGVTDGYNEKQEAPFAKDEEKTWLF